jgi:hypothetical protein
MAYRILILGASYGSLLGTKLLMAGHDVSLVCRASTAALINGEGTEVRIKLRGEDEHRPIRSADLPGKLEALVPEDVDPDAFDMVGLAMQEPQYGAPSIRGLVGRIAGARVPCLSIMNMPPLAYLRRLPGLDTAALAPSFSSPDVWDDFEPDLVTLCSPDPQAVRPPDEKPNVLHVGLPTNFRTAKFGDEAANAILSALEADIDAVRLDGKDVPVKLRVFESLFVPLAKWSMLLTGNYRCVTRDGVRPIREAVYADIETSRKAYAFVDDIARRLGAEPEDQVPFDKYAKAAEQLLNPSSVARAVAGGVTEIERVDKLVQLIGRDLGISSPEIDETVAVIDASLAENASRRAAEEVAG